jgi:hypothetical protein
MVRSIVADQSERSYAAAGCWVGRCVAVSVSIEAPPSTPSFCQKLVTETDSGLNSRVTGRPHASDLREVPVPSPLSPGEENKVSKTHVTA